MTKQEAINWLQVNIGVLKFDRTTGDNACLNAVEKKVIEAMEIAIMVLRAQIVIDAKKKLELTKNEIDYLNNDINVMGEVYDHKN